MSLTTLAPMTDIDAVNMMLASIGQAPVDTITNTGIADVNDAVTHLTNVAREIQLAAWDFNSDKEVKMTPDNNGYIILGTDVVGIESYYPGYHYTIRFDENDGYKKKVYDKTLNKNTYVFDANIKVNVTRLVPFDYLPQYAKNYVAIQAALLFQQNVVSSVIVFKFTANHLQKVEAAFNAAELRQASLNMLAPGTRENNILRRSY